MAVFRIEKTRDYTVMSNHHLRNTNLSLKAKGLLSLMLSLPENWDYTTKGLARICKDGVDSICAGVRELEEQGYVIWERVRNPNGQLGAIEYTILEQPRPLEREKPERENPVLDNPILGSPVLEEPEQGNPAQLNTKESSKQKSKTDLSGTELSNPIQSNPPRVAYINLKTSGQLTHHLNEIDREANEMLHLLIEQMAQAQGITEQLKAEDQITWVGAMNNIRSAAEEVILRDIINK